MGMDGERDLKAAVDRGFFILPNRGSGDVTLTNGGAVLRYDPELPVCTRARLVRAILDADEAGEQSA